MRWVSVLRVTARCERQPPECCQISLVVAGDVGPVVDIGVPCGLVGGGGIGARAVAVALVGEFRHVARAAIGTGDQHDEVVQAKCEKDWREALLCPAGHLPLKGGDSPAALISPIASVAGEAGRAKLPISPLRGDVRQDRRGCEGARSFQCSLGVAPWPLSSIKGPRWKRSSVKGALISCGAFLAMVQAKHQPEAGVALKPP